MTARATPGGETLASPPASASSTTPAHASAVATAQRARGGGGRGAIRRGRRAWAPSRARRSSRRPRRCRPRRRRTRAGRRRPPPTAASTGPRAHGRARAAPGRATSDEQRAADQDPGGADADGVGADGPSACAVPVVAKQRAARRTWSAGMHGQGLFHNSTSTCDQPLGERGTRAAGLPDITARARFSPSRPFVAREVPPWISDSKAPPCWSPARRAASARPPRGRSPPRARASASTTTRPEAAEALAAQIGGVALQADLRDEASADALVPAAVEALGRLDACVANAGTWDPEDVPVARMPSSAGARRSTPTSPPRSSPPAPTCATSRRRAPARSCWSRRPSGLFGEAGHADYSAAKAGSRTGSRCRSRTRSCARRRSRA